jgi:hypothetical protein
MSKACPQKIDKISVRVTTGAPSQNCIGFSRFRVFLRSQRREFKGTTKGAVRKNVEKVLQKNRQKSKPIISRFCFITITFCVLGRFSVSESLSERSSAVQKHERKKTNPTLVLFWPLTHPPTMGVTGHRNCFCRLLGKT